jgi:hypothetical protein
VGNCKGLAQMKKGFGPLCGIFLLLLAGLATLGGCGQGRSSTQALFTRPELLSRGRLAVLGLTPEQEQLLMARYTKTFSVQMVTFVERNRLKDLIGEQDLLAGRLNVHTRAKIKRILGVEALIMCSYYDATTGKSGKKLRIRIVDSETGAIIGSVITQAPDNFASHSSTAIKALWDDLMGKSQLEHVDRAERKRRPSRRI